MYAFCHGELQHVLAQAIITIVRSEGNKLLFGLFLGMGIGSLVRPYNRLLQSNFRQSFTAHSLSDNVNFVFIAVDRHGLQFLAAETILVRSSLGINGDGRNRSGFDGLLRICNHPPIIPMFLLVLVLPVIPFFPFGQLTIGLLVTDVCFVVVTVVLNITSSYNLFAIFQAMYFHTVDRNVLHRHILVFRDDFFHLLNSLDVEFRVLFCGICSDRQYTDHQAY